MVRSPPALRCSKEQSALHTLIRQRHLAPSCGGHAPTAERTMDPARMFKESLTSRPELENSQGHSRRFGGVPMTSGLPSRADPFAVCMSQERAKADQVLAPSYFGLRGNGIN